MSSSTSEEQRLRAVRAEEAVKHPQCWVCNGFDTPDASGFGLCAQHTREGIRKAMALTRTGKAQRAREHVFVGVSGRAS